MTKFNRDMISSLKVFIVMLTLIIPVGLALAMNDHADETDVSYYLKPAGKTDQIQSEPLEIVSMRNAISKTFDNGDGSNKVIIHIKPIHYQDGDGNWQEIDFSKPLQGSRSRESTTIQPGASDGKDSFILTGFTSTGVDQKELNVGNDPDFWMSLDNSPTNIPQMRIVIQFDVSGLPDESEIQDAVMKIYFHEDASGDQTSFTIQCYVLTNSWVEGTGVTTAATRDGVCWNRRDSTVTWSNPGGDHESSPVATEILSNYGWGSWDLQGPVQDWVDGTKNNYGVILIGTSGADTVKYLHTSDSSAAERPKLEINYISNKPPKVKNERRTVELYEDNETKYINLEYDPPAVPDGIFTDPDNDPLDFYVWTGTKWGGRVDASAFESENLTATIKYEEGIDVLEIKPKKNRFGTDRILLNASDISDAFIIYEMTIIIHPINDEPKINDTTKWKLKAPEPSVASHSLTCKEDQWCNLTVTAWDPVERGDDKKLKFSVNSSEDNAEFFTIEEGTGKVSFFPTNEDVGLYYLKITVNDQGEENNLAHFTFILEVENVNDIPYISEIATPQFVQTISKGDTEITISENAIEDKYFNFTVYGKDEDLNLDQSPERLLISVKPMDRFTVVTQKETPTKVVKVTFLPTNDDVGTFTGQLTVTDQDNEDTTIGLNINVVNVNDAPVISNFYFGTQILDTESDKVLNLGSYGTVYEATEKEDYTFNIRAVDIDPKDDLTMDLEIQNRTSGEKKNILSVKTIDDVGNPDEVTLENEITITPDQKAGKHGEIWINITVTDKARAEGLLMLRIPVENVNDPPPEPTIKVEVVDADRSTRFIKENLTIKFEAKNLSDPDGDNLNYSWDFDDTDGIQEDARGLFIDWTYEKEGSYTVTLTVDDGNGGTNFTTQKIQVIEPESKDEDGEDSAAVLGSVSGIPTLYIIIVIIVIVILLIVLSFVILKRKKQKEEEEAAAKAQAEQEQLMAQYAAYGYPMDQMAAYYQDPAMMAQYQAYMQQMMQQYPEQYQQMMQQYGGAGMDSQTALMQQLQAQPYTVAAGTGYEAYQQPGVQPQPVQTTELAQAPVSVLPMAGVPGQPQLPPASGEEILPGEMGLEPAAVGEPDIPESPFAEAQTQTLEEELGKDAAVTEIPVEPDTSQPELEVPSPELSEGPEVQEGPSEPSVEPEQAPEPEETPTEGEVEKTEEGEKKDEASDEVGTGKKCQNCGAAVKDGWFLCPECKKPLI